MTQNSRTQKKGRYLTVNLKLFTFLLSVVRSRRDNIFILFFWGFLYKEKINDEKNNIHTRRQKHK